MSSRNYLVLSNDMTLTDKKEARMTALAAGLQRCGEKGIGNIEKDVPGLQAIAKAEIKDRTDLIKSFIYTGAWPDSIDQRELMFLAGNDLVVATAIDSWLTAPLAAVGAFYSCFQAVAAPQLVQGKLMVCYAVSVETVNALFPVSRLIFRKGGAAGNIQAQFDMEAMGVRLEPDAFFSEPVVIDPQEVFAIQVRASAATGIAEKVHIHNFLFETTGLVIA